MEVRNGRLRWVVDDARAASAAFGGPGGDTRRAARPRWTIAEQVGKKVTVTANGTTVTMYDLQGKAAAILAAAGKS